MAESKKKTASKKSSTKSSLAKASTVAAAATSAKKTATKSRAKRSWTRVKKVTPHFIRDPLPEVNSAPLDTSAFATVLAIFVIALVVLGGYIYARQSRMVEKQTPALSPIVKQPQRMNISSAVQLTPEVIDALENIVNQITIGPDDVLQSVEKIRDVAAAKTETRDYFSDIRIGDMLFQFKNITVLYRPGIKQVIKAGVIPPSEAN